MSMNRLWLRGVGLVTLIGCLAFYDAGADTLTHRLLIPLAMAVGAWVLIRNPAAVALGGTVLAVIHANPGSDDWVSGLAYPLLAAAGVAMLVVIYGIRFKKRIRETRAERWAERKSS